MKSILLCFFAAGAALLPMKTAAAVVASAGPDISVAPNVPIILNGASSTTTTTNKLSYSWEQISGGPLDVLGQDRAKAMVVSASATGSYVFRLSVSDGVTTATDDLSISIVKPIGRTIYVDNRLTNNCLSGNYSIVARNGSGTNGNAYITLQAAANASLPGDTLLVRGGVYNHPFSSSEGNRQIMLNVTRSGTALKPILYKNYGNEAVTLRGWGFRDTDSNGDGKADGSTRGSAYREFLVQIDADYIQFIGFLMEKSTDDGLFVGGNYCYFEECVAADNWLAGFDCRNLGAGTTVGTVFRRCEAYRSRHASGFETVLKSYALGYIQNFAIVDCISHHNGFQPDGIKVLPIDGDPAGGGNSDGFAYEKSFYDAAVAAGLENYASDNYMVRNIAYQNSDDGIDACISNSLFEGNIAVRNGPQGRHGFKMLREVKNLTYRGNVSIDNVGRGFDLRPKSGLMTFVHNTMARNQEHGIYVETAGSDPRNNVAWSNALSGIGKDFVSGAPAGGANWAGDGKNVLPGYSGNPQFVSTNFTLNTTLSTAWNVKTKWNFLYSQVQTAYSPKAGSGLINKGQIIPGYHCPRADDDPTNPMPKSAPGRHWYGTAPDIGAFEFVPVATAMSPKPLSLTVTHDPQDADDILDVAPNEKVVILTMHGTLNPPYTIEQSTTAEPGSWSVAATGQLIPVWTTKVPADSPLLFWRVVTRN